MRWGNRFVFGPDETVIVVGNVEAAGAWARIRLGSRPQTPAQTNRMETAFHAHERLIDLILSRTTNECIP
jgi:hypothetical protein